MNPAGPFETLPPDADAMHRVIRRVIDEQMEAVGGPPTRDGLAWAVLHGLTGAGWRLRHIDEPTKP